MTAPFDIRILPFASQINQRTITPLHNLALKAEVAFCVRGVTREPLANKNFVARALEDVVEEQRERRAEVADAKAKLESVLQRLNVA